MKTNKERQQRTEKPGRVVEGAEPGLRVVRILTTRLIPSASRPRPATGAKYLRLDRRKRQHLQAQSTCALPSRVLHAGGYGRAWRTADADRQRSRQRTERSRIIRLSGLIIFLQSLQITT